MNNNLEIIKKSYACGEVGDIPGMLADLREDAEWTEAAGGPYGGTYRGAKEVLENVFQRIKGDWLDFACIPEEFYDAGDTIIMVGWYKGVNNNSKKSFEARVTHVWKLENGKIIKFEQIFDTVPMREAMEE